ncbi:MAG: segregation/condensation protein A [bacterium]
MEQYELQLHEFHGPLEKLLELIESKEMEITRLSLASVTADFLAYIKTIKKIHPRVLADFIAVAAKLILIKSHALLPSLELEEEEEKEIVDFEQRLQLYQRFKEAEKNIIVRWGQHVAFQRPYLATVEKGFYLTDSLTADDLRKALQKIIEELAVTFPRHETSEIVMVNLQEKITELLVRVDKTAQTSFNEMTRGKHRVEVIVLFLALLHLMRNQSIDSNQTELFSDIVIKKHL